MKLKIKDYNVHIYNEDKQNQAVLWIMGQHEKNILEYLVKHVDCLLIAVEIKNWNDDLSPWYAPAIFKGEDFKGKGKQTCQVIVDEIVPYLQTHYSFQHIYIVGYSLAGLFSLYAFHQCDIFAGAASCSGSLWYQDFIPFIKQHPKINKRIYLSLGNQEAHTRNKVMATVKDKTEELYEFYQENNICFYKLNLGNHFCDVHKRLLDGILYLLKEDKTK